MTIAYKPWLKRTDGPGTVEKQTPLALLVRMQGDKEARWVPKSGISNLSEVMQALNGAQTASDVKTETDLTGPTNCVLKPWRHQLEGYAYVMRMWAAGEGCLLEYGMGSGKTKITIDVLQNINCGPVLVVCPKSVVQNWANEVRKHGVPGRFDVLTLDKYSVAKRAEMTVSHIQKCRTRGTTAIIAMNYDSVWRPDFAPALKDIDVLVLDECQRIRGAQSSVSKFIGRWAPKVRYRVGLSGTPMSQGPLDIFGQYRALCPAVYGTRYTLFRSRYAVMGGFQGHQVIGYQNESELRQKYMSHALQCGREVLDLPPETHITRPVTLDPATMRIYKEMDRDLIACVKDGTVTAANALGKLLRLAQITGGTVPNDEGEPTRIGSEKQEVLQDILDDLDPNEPVVVFCRFHADMDAVHAAARETGRTSLELSGRVNQLGEWQRPGAAPVLAVQIQAGGVGVDLTRACYCVFYSVGYSLSEYKQALARTHRPGQDRPVTFMQLVATGTVDEKIYAALDKKEDVIKSIIGELTTST